MAYIGKQPVVGNFQVCAAISVVNGQAAYTMQVGSANVEPENVNHMLVSLNGVLQKPGSSFTISGATFTFASNLVTNDVIDFIILLGDTLSVGTPSDDSVGAAQIKADLISGTTALAAEPADTDEFLVSDAGVLKRIDYSYIKGGGITEADQFRLTTNFTGDASPLSSNLERVDTGGWDKLGTGMSVSSGIFTFPSTGIWFVKFRVNTVYNGQNRYCTAAIQVTTDNSSYANIAASDAGMENSSGGNIYQNTLVETLIDCTDTSNVKVKFNLDNEDNSTTVVGSSTVTYTNMMFIRLGDT